MTTTEEEIRALEQAQTFLYKIATRQMRRVPKAVQQEALLILRHFPGKSSLEIYWTKGKKVR